MIQGTNSIGNVNNYNRSLLQKKQQNSDSSTEKAASSTATIQNTDSFTKMSAPNSLEQVTYSRPNAKYTDEVNALLEEHTRQMEEFKSKILSMISGQNDKSNASLFSLNLSVSSDEIEAAKQAISEDGEWGVNAVATRIMDMAYALSGGDDSKLELLKNAVIDGFKAAGFDPDNRASSNMPEITGQTYDEIMKRFDDWKNKAAGDTGWEK